MATFYPGACPTSVPWPGKIIPYEFDASVTPAQQVPYLDGIKEWELAGGIDLVPHNGEANVISGNGAGNRIAYKGTIGIFVFGTADNGNTIRGNQIFSNNFLGIDLGGGTNIGFGATANDPDDADGGPNEVVIQSEGDAGWYHRLQVTTNMHAWIDAQGFRHYASGGAYGTGANGGYAPGIPGCVALRFDAR